MKCLLQEHWLCLCLGVLFKLAACQGTLCFHLFVNKGVGVLCEVNKVQSKAQTMKDMVLKRV